MPEPYPGDLAECSRLVLPQHHRHSPIKKESASRFPLLSREHDSSRTPISRQQLFLRRDRRMTSRRTCNRPGLISTSKASANEAKAKVRER